MEVQLLSVYQQVNTLSQTLVGLRNLLQRDTHHIEDLKSHVTLELRHSDLATRYLERVSSQPTSLYSLPGHEHYNKYPFSFYSLAISIIL